MRDPASVLWEEHTGGRILSLAVTDDSSVWALVDGPQLHVERFASTGELHANQPLAAPELPEGAVEARRDGGDIVYLDGAPIYGFSWTFLDGSGAELDRVARIERVDNAASAWIHEWPGADVRLGTAGEDLVGTDDVARFKFRSDGVEIWRVEDDEPGSFLDVEGLDNGSLMAMSRGLLIRYRADGVPAWFVNFESEPTDDFNTGIVALEDSALGILRSFRDDEDQILGGLIVFDQSGNIAHSQELPMPTSTFDLDEDGNVYAETPSSALAKFDPSEAVEWVADLEPAGGDGIVEVGPSGALYYAQGDSIIRLEP